jgi:hypothetical protein
MSHRRILSVLLFWTGPPLVVGIGAYLWPLGGVPDAFAHGKPSAHSRRATAPADSDAAATFAGVHGAIDSIWTAQLAARFPVPPAASGVDTRTIQDFLTQLEGESPDPNSFAGDDREISDFLWNQKMPLLKELVARNGGAAADWIDIHLPSLSQVTASFLADNDPDAALDHLSRTQRNAPCYEVTLFKIFSAKAASGGGEGLLAAVQQVPWHLCRPDNWAPSYELPTEASAQDARLWLTSGSALYLAQQGVELNGLFRPLVRADPQLAVATWSEWSGSVTARSDEALREMINSAYYREAGQPDGGPLLRGAFAATDAATISRLAVTLDRFLTMPAYDYLKTTPVFGELRSLAGDQPPSSSSAEAEGQPGSPGDPQTDPSAPGR